MTPQRRDFVLAVVLTAAVCVSGCSTVRKINPFHTSSGPKELAAEGPRISIIPAEQQLAPAEALKGVGFEIPSPAPVADWPLPGGTPEQSVENIQAAPNLSIVWRRNIGQGTNNAIHITAPPVEAAGKVFTMDAEAGVSAHDARTGAEVWRVNLRPGDNRRDRESFGGGVAYADGKLFVSSGYRFVAALDAATGRRLWMTRTDEPIHAAPTVAEGRVMVVALDNSLLTFNAENGTPGWTYQALSEPARILQPRGVWRHGGRLVRFRRTGGASRGQRQRPLGRSAVASQSHELTFGNSRYPRSAGDLSRRRLRDESLRRIFRDRPAHGPGAMEPAGRRDNLPASGR
jgi:hypothetical protein